MSDEYTVLHTTTSHACGRYQPRPAALPQSRRIQDMARWIMTGPPRLEVSELLYTSYWRTRPAHRGLSTSACPPLKKAHPARAPRSYADAIRRAYLARRHEPPWTSKLGVPRRHAHPECAAMLGLPSAVCRRYSWVELVEVYLLHGSRVATCLYLCLCLCLCLCLSCAGAGAQ